MGTIECSQPASKSFWDSQDFGDISLVLKMAHFRKSTGPRWVKLYFSLESNVSTKEPNIIHERNMYSNVFVFVGLMYKLVSPVLVYKLPRTRFI